jgi:hypothetical protein
MSETPPRTGKRVPNVWDNLAVGEAGGFRLAVICSQDDPSRWAMLVDTPLMQLWLEMPDHAIAHETLSFFEMTRGKKLPVRLDIYIGMFCGRPVRLTKNDEDERYFLRSDGADGDFFLRLNEDKVEDVASALEQVVEALDGRKS